MRRRIVFATNNAHKLDEIRAIAGDRLEVLSLADIGCHDDIPENEPTIEGNAIAKARWVRDRYGYDCFADDTGLMVDALGGEPGVVRDMIRRPMWLFCWSAWREWPTARHTSLP